jgi:hypothetical protein
MQMNSLIGILTGCLATAVPWIIIHAACYPKRGESTRAARIRGNIDRAAMVLPLGSFVVAVAAAVFWAWSVFLS